MQYANSIVGTSFHAHFDSDDGMSALSLVGGRVEQVVLIYLFPCRTGWLETIIFWEWFVASCFLEWFKT